MYSNVRVSSGIKRKAQDLVLMAGSDDCLSGCYHSFGEINVRPFLNNTLYFKIDALTVTTNPFEVMVQSTIPQYVAQSIKQVIEVYSATGDYVVTFGGNSPNLQGQIFDNIRIVFHCPAGTTATFSRAVLLSQ